jgi:Ca2+/H+ antiporter, TMEM165/GDT1 family
MIIWNVLMPDLFNLPNITFGQAIGLTILARLLTGGFRTGIMSRGSEHLEEKRKMWEKWNQMTPEERERWKVEWRARCSHRRPIGWKSPESDSKESDQI